MYTTCFIRPGGDGITTLVPAPLLPDKKELSDAVMAARAMMEGEGRELGFIGFKIIATDTGLEAHQEWL
jgi:hypothetical protein